MLHVDPELVCETTGRPAYAEFRMGQGAAWGGSRHDGSLFVAVSERVGDGGYCDEALDGMLDKGEIALYGDVATGLRPASELGRDAAVALFMQGVSYVTEALSGEGSWRDALAPLTMRLLGRPKRQEGPDFASMGRLWAFVESAKGLRVADLSPETVGSRLFDDVVANEGPGGMTMSVPELRRAQS